MKFAVASLAPRFAAFAMIWIVTVKPHWTDVVLLFIAAILWNTANAIEAAGGGR